MNNSFCTFHLLANSQQFGMLILIVEDFCMARYQHGKVFGTTLSRAGIGQFDVVNGPNVSAQGPQTRNLPETDCFLHQFPTCTLKHLVSILSPLVGTLTSHVRNSAEFSTFIAGLTLPPAMTLVSFDVAPRSPLPR